MATPISSPISTPPQLRDAINIGLVTTRRGILRPRRLLFDGVDDVHKCLYDNIENILCSPAKKAKKAKKIININNDEEICSICMENVTMVKNDHEVIVLLNIISKLLTEVERLEKLGKKC